MTMARWCLILALSPLLSAPATAQSVWRSPSSPRVRLVDEGKDRCRLVNSDGGEFTLESSHHFAAKPGDTFEVVVSIRVGINARALPELACYDADGAEVPVRSALVNAPDNFSTNRQEYRRSFAAVPGTATVRARIRGDGRGEVELAGLEFRPITVDPYQTGMLVNPLDAWLRKGVVLESNFGIVDDDKVASEDRDSDGKWALVTVDLDRITAPAQRGEDWRSRFETNPNAIFWSDGAVLKSDTVRADSEPDRDDALHFRARVHPGPYRVFVSDPGRAVAVSQDGRTWERHEGGREIDLGTLDVRDGLLELWLDACYRDPVTVGPAYFDYVRLLPTPNSPAADRLFRAAVQTPGRPERGSVELKKVEVVIRAPRFAGGADWPVRCGLPIPRAELAAAEHVAVEDEGGKRIPGSARATATWPDGSVKWLALDFRHDFSRQDEGHYRVVYGNRVRGLPPTRPLTIRPGDDGLEVDTGAIRFRVPRSRFGIVEDVRLADGRTVQEGPIASEIVESDGRRWRALDLPLRRLEVEEADVSHAVILAETKLPASGKPSTGFAHRARIHVYAGSPLIRLEYFAANVDSRPTSDVEGSMASKVGVKSFSLKLRPGGRISRAVTELGPADPAGALVQKSEELAAVGGRELPRQLRGWLSVDLDGGGGLALGVEGFREQFPKALRWRPDRIDIDLWAEEGGDFDWIEGVGKTHHLALYYGDSAPDAELLAHGRVLAVASPEWYCGSGAFGPIVPAAASPLPAVERTLARHMRESVVGKVGLGFENYGDHSSGGYVKGTFLWDNNEYDVPAACLVHFARTGDRDSLQLGLAGALHYLDIDTIHYSSRKADWAGAQHVHSHATFGHHTAQGPNMNHAGYVQGLIWYTYLTGEPIGLDGAKGIAAWVLRNLGVHTIGMERQLGHPLMTLNDVYEATWDDRWLRGAANLVDQAIKWEHPRRSGFLAPITESPAYYSGSPFCGGLITAGLLKFNAWAESPEIDRMLERVATWTLTDVWQPPAGIQGKGGSPRRRGDPQDIASHLRLMAFLYGRTGDPFFLAVPRRSVVVGFGDGAEPFGTRTTGLVFNYLPWFLQTLRANGNPQEDPDFVLKPDPTRLSATRGHELRMTVVVENRGREPMTDLSLTCRGRLDLEVLPPRDLPLLLQPGERRELHFTLRPPSDLNLTCQANRLAYLHYSALFKRDGQPRVSHAWTEVEIEK